MGTFETSFSTEAPVVVMPETLKHRVDQPDVQRIIQPQRQGADRGKQQPKHHDDQKAVLSAQLHFRLAGAEPAQSAERGGHHQGIEE